MCVDKSFGTHFDEVELKYEKFSKELDKSDLLLKSIRMRFFPRITKSKNDHDSNQCSHSITNLVEEEADGGL